MYPLPIILKALTTICDSFWRSAIFPQFYAYNSDNAEYFVDHICGSVHDLVCEMKCKNYK